MPDLLDGTSSFFDRLSPPPAPDTKELLKPVPANAPAGAFWNGLAQGLQKNTSLDPNARYQAALQMHATEGRSVDEVVPQLTQQFGVPEKEARSAYSLRREHAYFADKEPSTTELWNLRSVPYVSGVGVNQIAAQYKEARDRIAKGEAREGDPNVKPQWNFLPDQGESDYRKVARYERLQATESQQRSTLGGDVTASLAHMPAMLLEAYSGGKAATLVGRIPAVARFATKFPKVGRALGLAEESAVAEEGAPSIKSIVGLQNIATKEGAKTYAKETALDAVATAVRTPGQTAAMPSMYLPQSAERAIEKGGDWSDVDNLGRSYAIANLQVAVLGRLGPAGDAIPAGGPGAFGTRLAVRTGTGMIEQQAVDSIAQAVGLQEKKGTLYDAVNGEPGSLKNATTEAITFAAFSLMHGAPQKKGLKTKPLEIDPAKAQQAVAPVVETIDALKAQGQTPQQIGDTMQGVHQKVDAALVADPTLTKDQARKLFENEPPEVQKFAEVRISALPEKKIPIQDSSLAPREAVLKELGRQKGNEALLKLAEEMTTGEGSVQQQREHAKQVAEKLPDGNLKRYAEQLVEQAFGKEPAKPSVEPVKPSSEWTDPNAVVEPKPPEASPQGAGDLFAQLPPESQKRLAQKAGISTMAYRSYADTNPRFAENVRGEVETLKQMGKPVEPSFPKSVTVETRQSRKTIDGEQLDVHTIHDEHGKMIGDIHLVPRGKELNVQWVGAKGVKAGEVSNVVGRKNLRSVLEQIAAKYPDAEYLTGTRIGGARMHAGKTDQRVNVSLPGRGPQRRKGEPLAVEKPPEAPPDDPFNAPGLAGLLRKPAGEAEISPEAPKPADLPPAEPATPPKSEPASVVPEQKPVVPAGDVPSKANTSAQRVDGRKNVPPTEMARERVKDLLRESGVAIKQAEDLLARFEGKTLEEIGKARGVSKQAVDSNVVKALTKLELDRADIDQVLNDALTARGAGILERAGNGRVLPNELRVDPKETKKRSRKKQDAGEREIKRLDDLLEKLDKGELSREAFDAELARIAAEQQPARPAGADRPGPRAEAPPERPQAPVEPPAKEARVEAPAPTVAERSIMDVFDKGSETLKDHVEAQLSNLGLSLDMLPGYARESEDHARHVGRRLVSSWVQMVEEKAPAKDVRDLEAIMHKAVPDLKPVGKVGDKVGYDGLFHEGIKDVFTGDKVEIVRPGWSIKDDKGHEHVILKAEAKPSSSFLGSEVQGNLFGRGTRAPLPAKKGVKQSLVSPEMEAKANAEEAEKQGVEWQRKLGNIPKEGESHADWVTRTLERDPDEMDFDFHQRQAAVNNKAQVVEDQIRLAKKEVAAIEKKIAKAGSNQSLVDAVKKKGINAESLLPYVSKEVLAEMTKKGPLARPGLIRKNRVNGRDIDQVSKELQESGELPANIDGAQAAEMLFNRLVERKGAFESVDPLLREREQLSAARSFLEAMADPQKYKDAVLGANDSFDFGHNQMFSGLPIRLTFLDDMKGFSYRAMAKRWFASAGNLPLEAFEAKLRKDGRFGSYAEDVKNMEKDLRTAVKDYKKGGGYDSLDDAEVKMMNLALENNVMAKLQVRQMDPAIADRIEQMRSYIDGLSDTLIANGAAKGQMVATIDQNKGMYLNRAYRVFSEPDWYRKVDQGTKNYFMAWLDAEQKKLGVTLTQPQLEAYTEKLLRNETAYENPLAFIYSRKLGEKDLGIFTKRGDIPEPLRALWGEVKDPVANLANTVQKQAHMLVNHAFQQEVVNAGKGKFFFDEPTINADGEHVHTLTDPDPKGTNSMGDLAGKHMTLELKKAFEELYKPAQMSKLERGFLAAMAATKYSKTVLSPTGHIRNMLGNLFKIVSNGHYRVQAALPAVKVFLSDSAASRTQYRRLVELGVIGDGVHEGDFRKAVAEVFEGKDKLLANRLGEVTDRQIARNVKRGLKALANLYRTEDAVPKVYAYMNELASYERAFPNMPKAQLEEMAAKNVRLTFPTHSMAPRIVSAARRNPLGGPFPTFTAETIRSNVATLKLAFQEMKNPATRSIGARRLAGFVAAAALTASLGAVSRAITGTTSDEEEAMRRNMPSWGANSTIMHLGRSKDGKPIYIDTGSTDPNAYFAKIVNAAMRGQWKESGFEAAGPFGYDEEILTSKLIDVARNKEMRSGKEVYNPQAPGADQAWKIGRHVGEAFKPGAVDTVQRIDKSEHPEREFTQLAGQRVQEIDAQKNMLFKSKDFIHNRSEAHNLVNSVIKSREPVDDAKVVAEYKKTEDARRKLFDEMRKDYLAARLLRIDEGEIAKAMKDGGVSQDDIRRIKNGEYKPYSPEVDSKDSPEVRRRKELVRGLARP